MSKADTLLKKATFFERMALYSDRKTFLQALAQTGGASDDWQVTPITSVGPKPGSDAQVKQSLISVTNAGRQWVNQYGDRIIDAPGGSVMGNQYPKGLTSMYTLEQYAKLDRFDNAQLQQIAGILRQVGSWGDRSIDQDVRQAWYGAPLNAITEAQSLVNATIQSGGTTSKFPPPMPVVENQQPPQQQQPAPPKKAPAPTRDQWVGQLIGTLNMFASRSKNMNDAQKTTLMQQLDRTTLAELARIHNDTGGSGNPYSSPADQQLADKIEAAVRNFGQAFGPQAAQSANFQKFPK